MENIKGKQVYESPRVFKLDDSESLLGQEFVECAPNGSSARDGCADGSFAGYTDEEVESACYDGTDPRYIIP